MHKPYQNIEPGSNFQPKPISNPQNFNYLPQEDEKTDSEPQRPLPEQAVSRAQNYTLSSKISRNKAVNITILLILCLSIINLISLATMGSSFFSQQDLQLDIRRSRSRVIRFKSGNLKADPIMDIQIIDDKSTCPSGFQPLKLGNWSGTAAGCLCDNGDLFNSTCEKVGSEKCKTDIQSTLPIEMYEWEKSIFCVKRALPGIDYVKRAECPEGYQECYSGGCFKGDCPITKLEITSTGPTSHQFNNNEKYLLSTKTQGELPLINIQITFGDIPCFARDLFAETIKNSSYPLSAKTENQCDKYGLDSQFSTRIDSQTAYESFTENSFPYMTMHLPYFEENANATISILSSTVRMKTAKHDYCQDIDEKPTRNYFDTVLGKAALFFDPIIVWIVFFVQLMCILRILAHYAPKSAPELFEDLPDLQIGLYIANVIGYVLLIPKVIWTYHVGQSFVKMKGSFEEYLRLGCFEGGQGSEVISDYLTALKGLEGSFWVSFMFWFANISTLLVYVCYSTVKKKSARGNPRVESPEERMKKKYQ